MTVLLVPAALGCVTAAFAGAARRAGAIAPWRAGLLRAAVVCGVWTTAVTEIASLFGALGVGVVATAWALLAAGGLGAALCVRPMLAASRPGAGVPFASALLLGTAVIAAATLAVAWSAPPNTWDSMTYHMSRVAHWIQNRSIAHYPTHIPRQLVYAPWAETAILHLQVLCGGDRLANLVQWSALIGCMAGASAIAERLGPQDSASAATAGPLAALFVATCPMAILQASSTQNDAVAALWLACLAFFVLEFRHRPTTDAAVFAALSLGLGVLTKVTVYVFALPWVVWLGWHAVRRRGAGFAASLAVAVLAVGAGHHGRLVALWVKAQDAAAPAPAPGVAAAPPSTPAARLADRVLQGNQRYLAASPAPTLVLSSILRNAALELASPLAAVNAAAVATVERVHRVLGVASNDPRATYPPRTRFRLSSSRHEDDSGNPLHFLLAAGAALACLRRRPGDGTARPYAAALVASFVLFSAVFKWQPWHTRLLLPLLVLAAPLVAARLAGARRRAVAPIVAAVLWVACLPWLLFGEPRALLGERSVLRVGRAEQYFANRPDLLAPFVHAAAAVRGARCDRVGLILGGNDWEYPLWSLLGAEAGRGGPRIEHVLVANHSELTRRADGVSPCAIVLIGQSARERVDYGGVAFALGFREGPLQVFHR